MSRPPEPSAAAWSQAWERLVQRLPRAGAGLSPRALADGLRQAAMVAWRAGEGDGDLVPRDVLLQGRGAVAGHLLRDATRQALRRRYVPGDAGLALARHELLAPEVARALGDGTAARAALEERAPRLWVGPVLHEVACARLLAEIDRVQRWSQEQGLPAVPPNSMHQGGVILEDVGLSPLLAWLTREVVAPLSVERFGDLGGATLGEHHGFAVDYRQGGDVDLGFHVDDSEVTLNLCLGSSFEGGELVFRGLRCDRHMQGGWRPDERVELAHRPGVALLHAGRHRHEVSALRGGRRVNLILWCRSPALRARPSGVCAPWCGARGT